jgi:hypothetical protein
MATPNLADAGVKFPSCGAAVTETVGSGCDTSHCPYGCMMECNVGCFNTGCDITGCPTGCMNDCSSTCSAT